MNSSNYDTIMSDNNNKNLYNRKSVGLLPSKRTQSRPCRVASNKCYTTISTLHCSYLQVYVRNSSSREQTQATLWAVVKH